MKKGIVNAVATINSSRVMNIRFVLSVVEDNFTELSDPEILVRHINESYPGELIVHYQIVDMEDLETALETAWSRVQE